MANPDIAAALAALEVHLIAAGAVITEDISDVARGLPTGGRMIRYYWAGEVEPPHMTGRRVMNGELVGQRIAIVALWPLATLDAATVASIDAEMQTLAGEIRTRIQGDNDLGDHVESLDLSYGEPDLAVISGIRHVAVRWDLDLGYVEYPVAK
jgi:hypothetical protein